MTPVRPRSVASRCGLLIVAAVQFMAAAVVPFAHGHVPAIADEIVIAEAAAEQGTAAGHTDICSICQTLRAACVEPGLVHVAVRPAVTDVRHIEDTARIQSVGTAVSALPRAPPHI